MTSESPPSDERLTAALSQLRTLYPPPLAAHIGSTGGHDTRATWTALPSPRRARLLVPALPPPAVRRVLRRQLSGDRLRTRAARAVLGAVAASGVLGRLPGWQLVVSGPAEAPSIEERLRAVLAVQDLRLAMPIGTARANRKPVLQVTHRDGRVLAFVKVGHDPLTRTLVRREAAALRSLAQRPPDGVELPGVVDLFRWSDCEVLVLEPLVIPARRLGGEARRRRLLELVAAIAAVDGQADIPWHDHPWQHVLLGRLEDCGTFADPLRRHLDAVEPALTITTGACHGDLNSGNLALVSGTCPVWDWERFELGVPLGFDLLHHDLHEWITVRGLPPRVAASRLVHQAPALLEPLGVGPDRAEAVARIYLVTLACRYLADDQAGAGADLGRVGEWLVPTLEGAGS